MTVYQMIEAGDTVAIRDGKGHERIGKALRVGYCPGRWENHTHHWLIQEFNSEATILMATANTVTWIRKPRTRTIAGQTLPARKYVVGALLFLCFALVGPIHAATTVCYYNPAHIQDNVIAHTLSTTTDRFRRVGIDLMFVSGNNDACQDPRFSLFFTNRPTQGFPAKAVGIAFSGRAYIFKQELVEPNILTIVAMHELGHLFGLKHDKRSDIMRPSYDFLGQIANLAVVPLFDKSEGETMRQTLKAE